VQRSILIPCSIWRCVIGPGAALALIAIFYRISIPESPRYTLDVDGDGRQAVSDIKEYDPDPVESVLPTSTKAPVSSESDATPSVQIPIQSEPKTNGFQMISSPVSKEDQVDQILQAPSKSAEKTENNAPLDTTLGAIEKPTELPTVARPTPTPFWRFLWVDGNIRYLSATSICWFLLDFAFYGLGINNPRVIAAIWRPTSQIANSNWPGNQTSTPYDNISNVTLPDFENPYDPGTNIYRELFDNARQYVITVSIGSMLGSIFLLFFINYWSRRRFLIASFAILSGLFLATGVILHFLEFESAHFVIIIFYMLCQFYFNFGMYVIIENPAHLFSIRISSPFS
jgi:PHS family inorganic phosphate transporter-like MFS transporter